MNDRSHQSYGQRTLTAIDRFGVWLSRKTILRELQHRSDLDILELGCGFHASHLRALTPRLKSGVGVDFQIAPELKVLDKLRFYEGAIDEALVQLEAGAFDAVLMISVLEHLDDALSVVTTVRGLLRPAGVLLINVPTWRGKTFLEFSAFRAGLSSKLEMDDHKMYYDKRDLWPLLVKAGFKPSAIKLRYHKFGLNLFAAARRDDA